MSEQDALFSAAAGFPPGTASEGFTGRRRRSPTTSRPDLFRAIQVLRAAGFSILVTNSSAAQWLTVGDVAARLSVSTITVRRLIERGEIGPVLRWSTELRVSARGVESWIERHTQGALVEREERKA